MDKRDNREKERQGEVIEFASGSQSAQDAADPLAAESPATAALAEQVARLQAEKDELTQTMVRRQADFENYRKRIDRERQ